MIYRGVGIKKIFIILTIILPAVLICSPLNESFTGTIFPPIGWRVINNDGGAQSWGRLDTQYRTTPACASSRYESGTLRNDDWLITCRLTCSPTSFDTLKFYYRKVLPGTRESLEVRLSTTGNNTGDFTNLLWSGGFTSTTYNQKAIALDTFDGQNIYIAFVNRGLYQGRINLDDITGPDMFEIRDIGVDSILSPLNSFVMRPFGTGFQPQAIIRNYSNAIQRNIPVVCSIVGQNSGLLFGQIQYLDSLFVDSSAIITFSVFVPAVAELCTVKIRTLLANDTNPANNFKSRTTQIIRGNYTGGPDANFTYWIDSDSAGGPVYNWIDISSTGNSIPGGDAWVTGPISLGFTYNYNGESKTDFWCSTNGFISFDEISLSYNSNTSIPNPAIPNNIIAPFWDDLFAFSIRHQTFGTEPNRYKIIQWYAGIYDVNVLKDTIKFQVIIYESGDIVFQYNYCGNRYNLGRGQNATVGVEDASGTIGLQYLYNGISQGNLLNAGRAIRFYRTVHDVMPFAILTTQVGLGDSVLPKAIVKNIGTYTESFAAVFTINDNAKTLIYYDTTQVTNLLPASSCTLSFKRWVPHQYGTYSSKAWTTLTDDFNRTNDTCNQDIIVSIAAPVLLNPSNGYATNNRNLSFDWTDVANATRYNLRILNNIDTIVYYSHFGPIVFPEGNYYWQVRTGNQTQWGLWSEVYSFTIDTTPPLVPVLISPPQNCTLIQPYPVFVWQRVNDAYAYNLLVTSLWDTIINQIISDTFYISIQGLVNSQYFWRVRCYDQAMNWSNFSSGRTFLVSYPTWEQKVDIPLTNTDKPVYAGGCLTSISDKLYALKGNNTRDFYEYIIANNQWYNKNSIPFITRDSTTIKRKVKDGAALVCADEIIYALKGTNTKELWSYDPITDDWTSIKSVPAIKGIKGGSSLTYYDGNIYCLVGASPYYEFYRYNIVQDSWIALKSTPQGRNHRRFKSGSCIAYAGDDKIYALKGGSRYNEFYCYDIITNEWEEKDSLPYSHFQIRKKSRVKNGGAIAFDGQNAIYAIKGGSRNEFWKWNTNTNLWSACDTIPRLDKRSVVKGGAGLTYANNQVWLLKGNKTREVWAYTPFKGQNLKGKSQNLISSNCELVNNGVQSAQDEILYFVQNDRCHSYHKIVVSDNSQKSAIIDFSLAQPSYISFTLFDIQGRMVRNFKSIYMPAGIHFKTIALDHLPKGVYIILINAGN